MQKIKRIVVYNKKKNQNKVYNSLKIFKLNTKKNIRQSKIKVRSFRNKRVREENKWFKLIIKRLKKLKNNLMIASKEKINKSRKAKYLNSNVQNSKLLP